MACRRGSTFESYVSVAPFRSATPAGVTTTRSPSSFLFFTA